MNKCDGNHAKKLPAVVGVIYFSDIRRREQDLTWGWVLFQNEKAIFKIEKPDCFGRN